MTTNESIKAIKSYLRHSNITEDQYSSIIFEDGQATLNSATKFFYEYDNGAMVLTSLNDEFICELPMDELVEIFPSLYYQVNCDSCENSGKTIASHDPYETEFVDCECDNVKFKN